MDEIQLYQEMLTKDPASQVFVYLAEAFLERQMYEEAVQTCVNGLRLRPHDLRARVILGLSYLRTGALDRAEAELVKAREMLEINAVAYQGLAEIYEQKGDSEQAAHYLDLFSRLRPPENIKPAEASPEPESEPKPEESLETEAEEVATVTMAELYAQQGHLEKAAEVYRQILATAPDTVGVEDRLGKLEKEILLGQKRRNLMAGLESWLARAQEQMAAGPGQAAAEQVRLDPRKLADFVQRHYFRAE